MNLKTVLITLLITVPVWLNAQFEFPSPSPKGNIVQVVGDTKVEVEYERPLVRGRQIFGALVPWNKVWRTGAGKCTRVSFDKAVLLGNQPIEAGSYSLFTIPNEKEWVVIINADTTLNGSGFYDAKKDIARFAVKAKKSSRFYEALTIDIDLISNNARMYISWADQQIGFDVHTMAERKTLKYIDEQLLTGKEKDFDQYGMAAWYLIMNNMRYNDALVLADKMMKGEGNESWGRNLKYSTYEKMLLYDKSLEELEKGLKDAKERKYEKEVWRQQSIDVWNDRKARILAKQQLGGEK